MKNFELDDRESYIVYLLGKNERLSISQLCDIFYMVPSSIRKVLTNMEKKGVLIRTHGGAVSIDFKQVESFERKIALNVPQKKMVAKAARAFIKDGDTIALGDGSTVGELCLLLHDLKDAIVYTDSIAAANILMYYDSIEVRICSGIVQRRTGTIVGASAAAFFDGVSIDKAFIGADSISIADGVGNTNILVSQVDRAMLHNAKERFVLCDYSKFSRGALAQVVPITEIDHVITDPAMDLRFVQGLRDQNINVVVADS